MYQSSLLIIWLIASSSMLLSIPCLAEENTPEMSSSLAPENAEALEKAGQQMPPVIDMASGTVDFDQYAYRLNMAGLRIFIMDIQYSDPEIFLQLQKDYNALQFKNDFVRTISLVMAGGGTLLVAVPTLFYMLELGVWLAVDSYLAIYYGIFPGLPRRWPEPPGWTKELTIAAATGGGLCLTGLSVYLVWHVNEKEVGAAFKKYVSIKYGVD